MLAPFSRLEEAARDLLVHKAEGTAHDRLASLFGIPRPASWTETSWRRALHAVAFGARGTLGSTFAFLEAALADYGTDSLVIVDPAAPQTLDLIHYPWPGDTIGRLIRLDGVVSGLYCAVGPWDASTVPSNLLTLAKLTTPYWQGADWAAQTPDAEFATATVLPFFIREPTGNADRPVVPDWCCKVHIYLSSVIQGAPATYIQEDDSAYPAPPQPKGGFVLDTGFTLGSTIAPAYPIYLEDGTLLTVLATRLNALLAAGVQAIAYKGA